MRMTFDDYNKTCEVIDGSAAIYPYNLGLLMLRNISSTGRYEHAKHCVINAFDTNYLMSADEVIANILHRAESIDKELLDSAMPTTYGLASPKSAFVDASRGSHSVRDHISRDGRGGRGLPNKCGASG
jgi:hypothetical protein